MEHRLDPLIAERAPWLYRPGALASVSRAALMDVLRYRETVDLASLLRETPAYPLMDRMAARLARQVHVSGLRHVPEEGAALIVANHPTGIADGIMLHHVLSARRRDHFFYANSDILRVMPQLSEMIAPVEWREEKRSRAKARETMLYTRKAVEEGRLGVIFPSGRLAKRRGLRLHERPWMASAASLARRFDLPVIPIHIRARNSALFYALDLMHPTLRDITLFHETLNKDRQPFQLRIGQPIQPHDLPQAPTEAIAVLREATLSLGRRYPRATQPMDPGWWASAARTWRSKLAHSARRPSLT